MACNIVQFQSGPSSVDFLKKSGIEQARREALFQLRWPSRFRRPECGNVTYCEIESPKSFRCYHCGHQASLTARTIFDGTKRLLTKWFLGIFLLKTRKTGLSALALSRHLGVSHNTTWQIKPKFMQTMRDRDEIKSLSIPVQIDDLECRYRRGR